MNASQLADMVRQDARRAAAFCSPEVVRHIELSGIASWLALQDEQQRDSGACLRTALAAIDIVRGATRAPESDPPYFSCSRA